jgi:hypothetical protein
MNRRAEAIARFYPFPLGRNWFSLLLRSVSMRFIICLLCLSVLLIYMPGCVAGGGDGHGGWGHHDDHGDFHDDHH